MMFDLRGQVFRAVRVPLVSALLLGSALAVAPVAMAQETQQPAAPAEAAPAPVTPDTVVATVGGENITEGDLAFAAEDNQQQLQGMPAADARAYLLTVLIDMKLMAKAAREAGMDQTDLFKKRLKFLEERALRRVFFAEKIQAAVTPEAVQAAYDAFVASYVPEDEIRAKHILVATKEDADAVKAELATGRAFEDIAKEKSTDPSAVQNGGDLGFFAKERMVKPFADAAFALEVGQVSEPVQSEYGWHIIRVEEKRKSAPPSMQDLLPELQQQVMFQAFETSVGGLKEGLEINVVDPALAAAVGVGAEGTSP